MTPASQRQLLRDAPVSARVQKLCDDINQHLSTSYWLKGDVVVWGAPLSRLIEGLRSAGWRSVTEPELRSVLARLGYVVSRGRGERLFNGRLGLGHECDVVHFPGNQGAS